MSGIHDDDGGRRNIAGCEPQPPVKFLVEITLGPDLATPADVRSAIADALGSYGSRHSGTLTPFAEQPGFPAGYIISDTGRRAGEWRVTS